MRATWGGVGGNRMLLKVPEPITSELWPEVTGDLRNVRLGRLSEVDARGDPQQSSVSRAKQPSAGGRMVAYSPKSGTQRAVEPWQSPDLALGRKAKPLSEGGIPAERLN